MISLAIAQSQRQPASTITVPAQLSTLAEGPLADLALRGAPDAYGELVRRYQGMVYNIAYRLIGDHHEALDVAQEAFVRAFGALASYDQARAFGPWIGRITTNLALNWLQRRRVATLPLGDAPGDGAAATQDRALHDYSAEPERLYLAGEQHELVRRAILALPPHYRAVIELRHFQDCSYDEIALALALPLSDVKSHLFRARRLLRDWLEEHA
ncbi:MAG: sigma-70 family RNA polymerase sigma factor [Kouleothrix sp.]|jgi:RNA polymerase sigma-70 factor (ECF subfamily)|nr:sigma-70 family RNA polymerase sigma factor [Kouleothrix sp.]